MSEPAVAAPKPKKLPKNLAIIDSSNCTGCEVCIEFCDFNAIVKVNPFDLDAPTGICQVVVENCVGCTLCTKACPWEVIQMFRIDDVKTEIETLVS